MSLLIKIIASIFVFGLIIFIHEFGHFIVAKKCKIKVNEFAMGLGPKIWSRQKGETLYSLRLLPIGGFCAMEGEDEDSDEKGSFSKAPVWQRFAVIVAGAVMNLILGFIVLLGLTASEDVLASRTISVFQEGAVTQSSGLAVGDTILAINGRKLYIADDILYELVRIKDGHADVVVLRDGEKMTLENVEFPTEITEDGTSVLTLDFKVFPAEKTFGNVMKKSALWTVAIGRQRFLSVVDLVTGNVPINQLSGPVGIVEVISDATTIGFGSVMMILAFISINLGVFNLLPLPALDGGRLVFILFEGITKKRLDAKYEAIVHTVGFVLLIALMIFVSYQDVSKWFTR